MKPKLVAALLIFMMKIEFPFDGLRYYFLLWKNDGKFRGNLVLILIKCYMEQLIISGL